ncbi:hypothetical protein N9166_01385 [bacterium]|nr:hypothetical protein [bacterium]
MHRALAAILIAFSLCLGSVGAGAADLEVAPPTDADTVRFFPDFGERKGFLGRRQAQPFGRLGVFVERTALPVGLRTSMFDIEGGATLELRGNLLLKGGYRVIDYAIDSSGGGLDFQHAGPCIALSLRF